MTLKATRSTVAVTPLTILVPPTLRTISEMWERLNKALRD
jgi:hypothetical protein